jgi:LuxR family transcriptional regulator, quorum-sensing system regulator BjaR1
MDEGSEFGLKEGFTVSLTTLDGQSVVWSLGGPHLEIGPHTRAMLTLIASYDTARAIVLKQESQPDKPIFLSPLSAKLCNGGPKEKTIGKSVRS